MWVSSATDAALLAESPVVARAWRAALALKVGVAKDHLRLTISMDSQRRLASLRGLREAARKRLRLSYAIVLPAVPEGRASAIADEVVAPIKAASQEVLTTALAEAASKAMGGGRFGLAVETIGQPTADIVVRDVSPTETTSSSIHTSATGIATESEPEDTSGGRKHNISFEISGAPGSRAPAVWRALGAAALLAWSL